MALRRRRCSTRSPPSCPTQRDGRGSFVITTDADRDLTDHSEGSLDILDHVYGTEHVVGTLSDAQAPYLEQTEALEQ